MFAIFADSLKTVNLATWDHYHDWDTHVQGAITLLAIRGSDQFSHERGGQLFMQIRSQIVCLQIPIVDHFTNKSEAACMRAAERSCTTSDHRVDEVI